MNLAALAVWGLDENEGLQLYSLYGHIYLQIGSKYDWRLIHESSSMNILLRSKKSL